MPTPLAALPEPEPLRAVTVSRDVQAFDLLIEDMEAELGEAWADLDFTQASTFLRQDEARGLEFVAFAVGPADAADLPRIADVVRQAKRIGLPAILVAEGLDKGALRGLLYAGVDEFTPYPLTEAALSETIARLRDPGRAPFEAPEISLPAEAGDASAEEVPADGEAAPAPVRKSGAGAGAIFAVQSAAGGDGATTVAVNLAWELANAKSADGPRVCIIDLGLQFGSVATYLDLPRKPMILEVLSDVAGMDEQAFRQALCTYKGKLGVFTSPADILPLDLIGPADVTGLLTLAQACFDIVIVDMPGTMTGWTDTVLCQSDLYFVVCGLEVRSAHNALRLQKLFRAEGLPVDHMAYVLNRGPGKMDLGGRARVAKMADSLDVSFHAVLPDGGKQVTEANDQAMPLGTAAPRNALTKEIRRIAGTLLEARSAIDAGAADPGKRPGKKAAFGLSFG